MVGLIVERLVIRFLYGRMIDTMLATWGLSLLLIGLVTLIFGNSAVSVPAPIPGYQLGELPDGRLQPVHHRRRRGADDARCGWCCATRASGLIARGAMQSAESPRRSATTRARSTCVTFTVGRGAVRAWPAACWRR